MESVLININVTNNVQKATKKYQKIAHLTQRPSSLSHELSGIYHLQPFCCVIVPLNLVVFYGEMDYICHKQSFVVPNNLNDNKNLSFKL
jgi:hypothetical protein